MKRFMIAAALALGLAGCTVAGSAPGSGTAPPEGKLTVESGAVLLDGAVLEGTRALTLAGVAVDTVQVLAIGLIERDLLPPPALRTLAGLNADAEAVLLRGYQARSNAARLAAAAELLLVRDRISALIGSGAVR